MRLVPGKLRENENICILLRQTSSERMGGPRLGRTSPIDEGTFSFLLHAYVGAMRAAQGFSPV